MKKSLPNFTNKVVSFGLAGSENTHSIENPRFETQADRLFLVGTVPPGGSTRDWCEGIVCAVAWERVTDYLVFDSAEDYRKRLRVYEKRKGKG